MLRNFGHSLPFFVLRIIIVVCEGLTLAFGAYTINGVFTSIVSQYVGGLFLTMLTPMGWIVGIALSAFVVKYLFGIIKYYLKIVHIIYMTMITLEYKENFIDAFTQAVKNFSWLFINDMATKGIVQGLKALKDAILNVEILQKFKAPESSLLKFVTSLCTNGLTHIIDMTDEIIISYTWFTNDMLLDSLERKGKPKPTTIKAAKNQAKFILEGMVFLVRVLPQLLISTLIIEASFLIIANLLAVGFIGLTFVLLGYNFIFLIAAILLYKMVIDLIYYALIEPIRITLYIYAFYSELSELEPLDITQEIAKLLGKVPVLGEIAKRAGLRVEASGSEGEALFDTDFSGVIRDNVATVASAFNLNVDDLMEDLEVDPEHAEETEEHEQQTNQVQEQTAAPEESAQATPESQTESTPSQEPPQEERVIRSRVQEQPVPVVPETTIINGGDLEVDIEEPSVSNPFATSGGQQVIPPKRRKAR